MLLVFFSSTPATKFASMLPGYLVQILLAGLLISMIIPLKIIPLKFSLNNYWKFEASSYNAKLLTFESRFFQLSLEVVDAFLQN